MTARLVRLALAVLSLLNLGWGAGAVAAPRWAFDHFPGFGFRWTSAYPPYNEHLMTDLGATFLCLGALLAAAAWLDDRRVSIVVLAGVLVFNTAHLIFHATDHGQLAGFDLAASITSLVLGVLVPAVLLGLVARRAAGERTAGADAPRRR